MSYAILINTCDNHIDALDILLFTLKKMWPESVQHKIYINTECLQYTYEDMNIQTLNLQQEGRNIENLSWSERLMKAIDRINEDYILMILEDFWLNGPVCNDDVERCYRDMIADKRIASISMAPYKIEPTEGNDGFYHKLERNNKNRISCQIVLWKKSFARNILRKHEDAWHFETYGSIRSRHMLVKLYAWRNLNGYLFDYDYGKVIYRGCWWGEYVEKTERINGIHVDTSTRRFYENGTLVKVPSKRNIFKKVFDLIKSLI